MSDVVGSKPCFTAVARELGEVDTLLYNAGSGVFADVETITAEQFEQAWRVNALGSLLCARKVIPAMKAMGAGDIWFIGATALAAGAAGDDSRLRPGEGRSAQPGGKHGADALAGGNPRRSHRG